MRCLDEKGSIRLIPTKNTSLYVNAIGNLAAGGGFVATVDNLLAIKELLDHIDSTQQRK